MAQDFESKAMQMIAELMQNTATADDAVGRNAVLAQRWFSSGLSSYDEAALNTLLQSNDGKAAGLAHLTKDIIDDAFSEYDYTNDERLAGFMLKADRTGDPSAISVRFALMRPS